MFRKGLMVGVLILFAAGVATAQVTIFEETFGAPPGPGVGDPLPAGWTAIDVDGQIVHANVSYVTDAWVVTDNFDDPTDAVAASTSWYATPGTSDDWMISPAIVLTASNTLSWDAKAQDPAYPDGYEVWLSTTTPTIPAMTNALFSTPAESATWVAQSADLSAFVGQTVYVGFRNNSADQFMLLIDDVVVTDPVPVELMSFSVN